MRTKNTDLKDVWQTPKEITDLLPEIDLDPCAGKDTSIGKENWRQYGLIKHWYGNVFVNPPFTMKNEFLEKAVTEHEKGNTDLIFFITPDSTDTKSWWHKWIKPYSTYIWFSKGRIAYIDPNTGEQANAPTFGTAISIFGNPSKSILEGFLDTGHLVRTIHEIEP